MMRALLLSLCLLFFGGQVRAEGFVYDLHPVQVAAGTYVLIGDTHFFNRDNGGNIANTGFIVTKTGVVVIDTGPSRLYGEAMRRAIKAITPLPVVKVIITHAHPDHFLGSQAFAGARVVSGPGTVEMIRKHGQELASNLYTLVGDAMQGTEVVTPELLDRSQETIGGHELRYYFLSGHTDSDLVVFDAATGVLFVGDLVFFRRALTVPNANVARWQESLTKIEAIPYRQMVPGHGPMPHGGEAVAETRDYLRWLNDALQQAMNGGLDLTEAFHIKVPERFRNLAIVDEEFRRSVAQMFPRIEEKTLPAIGSAQ